MTTTVLFDVDSRIPNLALMKLSTFYKLGGSKVILAPTICKVRGDRHFASVVFHSAQSQGRVDRLHALYGDQITIGGSGCDPASTLPDEVDRCFPDYSLYQHTRYALGFLTRGCNKRCAFCVVPKKEGPLISHYATFADFVPKNQFNVMLLDNNLLAASNIQEILRDIIRRGFNVNFNQTLDIQYLSPEVYALLQQINSVNSKFTRKMIYFSCNTAKQTEWFYAKADQLKGFGRGNVTVVVMFGFNTRLSEDFEILKMTKKLGLLPFVQQYQPILGVPAKIPDDFFDIDLDEVANFRFRSNGRNGEKFLRYVNERYFDRYGRYYLPILRAIYRYNNKTRLQYYLDRPGLLSEAMYRSYV